MMSKILSLGEMALSTQLMDASQISDYISEHDSQISDQIQKYALLRHDDSCIANGEKSYAHGDNSITYSDNCIANGLSCSAGTRSFRIISGDMFAKTWKLHSVAGLSVGMMYSVHLLANYDAAGTITQIDAKNKIISVDYMPGQLNKSSNIRPDENLSDTYLSGMPYYMPEGNGIRAHLSKNGNEIGPAAPDGYLSAFVDKDSDHNTMWIIGHPELGDLSAYSIAAQCYGYNNIATKQFSHVEGADNIAIGKYAHIEGFDNIAGYNTHVEGQYNSGYGRYSHVDGSFCESHDDFVYLWNGDTKNKNKANRYASHGPGTYNVNPLDGINGFYIGEKNLNDHIAGSIAYNEYIDKLLYVMLNPADDKALDDVWVGNVFETTSGKKREYLKDTLSGSVYYYPEQERANLTKVLKLANKYTQLGETSFISGSVEDTSVQSFWGAAKLTDVNVNNVTRFGLRAFQGCTSLSSISCDNVQTFENGGCFIGCKSLSSISLPSAKSLVNLLFMDCTSLAELDLSKCKTVPTVTHPLSVNGNIFAGIPAKQLSIYIPAGKTEEWLNTSNWKEYELSVNFIEK